MFPLPPFECRFDDGCLPVVWLFTPRGCVCFPDDRAQALCMQHVLGDGMIGPTEVMAELDL